MNSQTCHSLPSRNLQATVENKENIIVQYFEEELANMTEVPDWERGGNINYHMHLRKCLWNEV